jgi:four helix bundle protein
LGWWVEMLKFRNSGREFMEFLIQLTLNSKSSFVMTTIRNFEDLRCWQNARELNKIGYLLSAQSYQQDYSTRDQFRRASLSVMNNIAEGFTRFSPREKIRFLEIAQSSAAEVISMLYLFEDIDYLDQATIEELREKVSTTRYQILAFMKIIR